MDEFSFIDSIKQYSYHQPSLIKGIGDDAAVFHSTNKNVVTAVDTFVDGVHFSKQTMKPFYIGYRALAANLSDLAAMGAVPAFYLVSIVIPKDRSMSEISEIFTGMKELAEEFNMDLIGGDTVSGTELSLSITVIGYTDMDKARYRSDACAGDIVFVTGTLGDSQAGFHMLMNEGEFSDADYFIGRHRMPSPRVEFASRLSTLSRLCLNDISDGLASESNEIAEASNVVIEIMDDAVPTHPSFHQFSSDSQYQWKYSGGEDFEILGTVSKRDWPEVERAAEELNMKVTKIGYVKTNNQCGVFLNINKERHQLKKKGYNHLK
ncbi:thiamine-phosphate kinase [Oceanobacillus salinisoli]|uniref:thiamine-phosphate kinase n=1 Tax=Oceanobacillus salinisoli TaxID=2678611 RepID=UPI0012E1F3A7|nr:thiamine-phosphate kinase [Oceanobacillus salinisoli]